MENTLENKAKFFMLHFGQKVYNNSNYPDNKNTLLDWDLLTYTDKAEYLELKSLSSISDEDAIEMVALSGLVNVSKIERNNGLITIKDDSYSMVINSFNSIHLYKWSQLIQENVLKLYDFLRSRGYALPWMGLSVDKLIEYGWIRLNQN